MNFMNPLSDGLLSASKELREMGFNCEDAINLKHVLQLIKEPN
jgi:hypothetical protein